MNVDIGASVIVEGIVCGISDFAQGYLRVYTGVLLVVDVESKPVAYSILYVYSSLYIQSILVSINSDPGLSKLFFVPPIAFLSSF